MPIDKAIDSAQLDANLTAVADAIRERAQTSDPLVFPDGFVTTVSNLGGSGATLTVTTPSEGVTVTVSKGELSYTKTAGADYTATFTGLESGAWTITISNGTQTATGSIDIDADYASTITFFETTINVTYPAGSVCTATDGVTTLTAPDTSGTWACIVPNAGTWTVSLDNGFAEIVETEQNGETYTIDKWYLYKSGDERTYVTGGWTATGWTSSDGIAVGVLDTDRIKMYGTEGKNTILATDIAIPLPQYSRLFCRINVLKTVSNYSAFAMRVKSSKSGVLNSENPDVAIATSSGTGNQILEIPLNGVPEIYILLLCYGDSGYKTDVFEVWFE